MFSVKKIKKIVAPSHLSVADGGNINGPTCIKVPSWCENKVAKYYLYFSHHSGKTIRMCYADDLCGTWTNWKGGVLGLDDMNDAHHHIASPEIYINSKAQLIYLYFHAPSRSKKEQWTFLAISHDGIHFNKVIDRPLAPFYMRVFHYSGYMYGMVKGGDIWKSKDGINEFKSVVNPFDPSIKNDIWHNYSGAIRHVGLYLDKHILHIFFSKIGDKPECILHTSINLDSSKDKDWKVDKFREIIRPEEKYEGAELPLKQSSAGAAHDPENALRDPYIMYDSHLFYLFYSIAGEKGIALAQFKELPSR
mgnify:FL=1|jgi:hypothetical protein